MFNVKEYENKLLTNNEYQAFIKKWQKIKIEEPNIKLKSIRIIKINGKNYKQLIFNY